jgi:hypothetical protein
VFPVVFEHRTDFGRLIASTIELTLLLDTIHFAGKPGTFLCCSHLMMYLFSGSRVVATICISLQSFFSYEGLIATLRPVAVYAIRNQLMVTPYQCKIGCSRQGRSLTGFVDRYSAALGMQYDARQLDLMLRIFNRTFERWATYRQFPTSARPVQVPAWLLILPYEALRYDQSASGRTALVRQTTGHREPL